jgi:hypothetical protein
MLKHLIQTINILTQTGHRREAASIDNIVRSMMRTAGVRAAEIDGGKTSLGIDDVKEILESFQNGELDLDEAAACIVGYCPEEGDESDEEEYQSTELDEDAILGSLERVSTVSGMGFSRENILRPPSEDAWSKYVGIDKKPKLKPKADNAFNNYYWR